MDLVGPDGNYSSIEEIIPPVNGMVTINITEGSAFGP